MRSKFSFFLGVWIFSMVSLSCGWAWSKCRYPANQVKWYVVQAGESCWSIAIKLFADGRKYELIHRYNDLGSLPHILQPGMKLCFPASTPEPDAKVSWKRRTVEARPPRSVDWRNAYQDMALWKLYHVRTQKNALAGIRFRDRSELALRELSRIIIYGRAAQRIRFQALAQRTIEVEEGTIRGGLASLDAAVDGSSPTSPKSLASSPIIVKTPAGEIELRSKEAQIEYQTSQKTSVVSVYQGEARVRAVGKEVKVPENFGTYVKKGQAPAKPKRLPRRPRWLDNKTQGVALIIPGVSPSPFVVRWQAVPSAARYRVEWSNSAKFSTVLQAITTRTTQAEIPIIAPSDNTNLSYYVRVSARTDRGLEGKFSAPFTLAVVRFQMSAPRQQQGEEYVFSGFLHLKALTQTASSLMIAIGAESANFSPLREGLVLLRPGSYLLRFRQPGQSVESTMRVKILPIRAAFVSLPSFLDPKNKHAVMLQLWDKNKNPSAVPGLQITAYPGGSLLVDAVAGKRGTFTATLPAYSRHPGEKIVLVATWLGGELGRTSLDVKRSRVQGTLQVPAQIEPNKGPWSVSLRWQQNDQPQSQPPQGLEIRAYPGGKLRWRQQSPGHIVANLSAFSKHPGKKVWIVADWQEGELDRKTIAVELPKAPGFVWPDMVSAPEWANVRTGLSSRTAQPLSMVGLISHFQQQQNPNNPTESEFLLRMAVRGELALWQGRIGLDADLPWLVNSLSRDMANQNRLGDFRLGAKIVAWSYRSFLLTPSLRLRFPTGGIHTTQYDMGWEPGLLLAWTPHPMIHVASNQILVFNTDFSSPLSMFYTSSYTFAVRPLSFLSLGLELNLALRLLHPNQTAVAAGLGLGGSVRFHIDRFRVGLVASGPLHHEALELLGGFTLGLSLDVGFNGL